MGQTVRLGKTNTLSCKSRMEIYFGFMIFYFLFCYVNFLFFIWLLFYLLLPQNRQVMVTSLGRCCLSGTRVPQSPDCQSSFKVQGKMRECGGDDAKGMVNDNEGVRSLGGRGMSRSIRDGICVCVVVVVVVAVVLLVVVLIVAMEVMGVVVFMVVLGIVVRVACVGVVGVVGDSHPDSAHPHCN